MIPNYVINAMYYIYQDNKTKKDYRKELYDKLYEIY